MQAVGLKVLETNEEPRGRVAEVKPGCRRTEAERVRLRTKEAEGKGEPDGAKRVEGRVADEGLEVHVEGRTTTDQGRAGGMRKPGGAVRTTIPGGAEGARCQGEVGGSRWS